MTGNGIPQAFAQKKASFSLQTNPPPSILLVENELDLRHLNAEALQSSGYEVFTAENGMAGWKALHAVCHAPKSYDLLITDHDMPELTGLALVEKMRAAHMMLPVIITSRTLPTEDFIIYPWLHPVAMLVKPYSVQQLLGTVEKMLCAAANTGNEVVLPTGRPIPPPDDIMTL